MIRHTVFSDRFSFFFFFFFFFDLHSFHIKVRKEKKTKKNAKQGEVSGTGLSERLGIIGKLNNSIKDYFYTSNPLSYLLNQK